MELSERIIATLEAEGCTGVCEEQLASGADLPTRSFPTPVTYFVTDGSIVVDHADASRTLTPLDRIDIEANIPHTITAGTNGCNYVVGEW